MLMFYLAIISVTVFGSVVTLHRLVTFVYNLARADVTVTDMQTRVSLQEASRRLKRQRRAILDVRDKLGQLRLKTYSTPHVAVEVDSIVNGIDKALENDYAYDDEPADEANGEAP